MKRPMLLALFTLTTCGSNEVAVGGDGQTLISGWHYDHTLVVGGAQRT